MTFLTDDLLDLIHERAPEVDATNTFPDADLADLRAAGYLAAFVPTEFGGGGLTVEEVCAEQTRLAKASPATALGINMHQIIVGVGRHLAGHGIAAGETILREAAAGELFGFAISEPGNDLVLFGSTAEARPDGAGGYTFHGEKVFTSLAPVWTRLLTFGADRTDPDAVRNVFAILTRDAGGFDTVDDWDTLGMRGTQSNSTTLNGAPAPADRVLQVVEPGPSLEPIVFGIFSHFEVLLGATYLGMGLRAIEVAAAHVKNRRSVKNDDVYAHDPDIRWRLADAAIRMNSAQAEVTLVARELDEGRDHGMLWLPKLSSCKNAAAEASLHAVEQAIRACGGSSYSNSHELTRLYRDVLAGLFQPSDQESLHGAWANVVLGPIAR
ncbi:MAG: acyl-CoA dehydrogenase family protein [Propionibacteriaceae bacterium]|nr:acyl-CoA dehydrogenase family protein [Propionibacteriaceae bacterium]